MRGITCVPDPKGSNNDVIIGAKNKGGEIQIIEISNNHNTYTELDVTQYCADLWFEGDWPYNDYALIAYNEFTLDTIDDQPVWWVSLRSEEHTSELQSRPHLVCRLLLEKKNKI